MKNTKVCLRCNNKVDNSARFCLQCGYAEFNETTYDRNPEQERNGQNHQFPMKWYKWVKDLCILSAILDVIHAISYFTGTIYGDQDTIDAVYMTYGGLKTVDFACGIFLIAMACFELYTRSCLAKYKANGPLCLYLTYGADFALSLFYCVAAGMISGEFFGGELLISFVSSAGIFLVNYIYFNKRKILFIN